jgi:hypothetical protein
MPEPNRWYVSYTVKSDHGPRRRAQNQNIRNRRTRKAVCQGEWSQ